MAKTRQSRGSRVASAALRALDVWSAILLLTGQVTVSGVFFSSGGMWLSFTGPILGSTNNSGTNERAERVLDGIEILTAILLILGQITNTGPWISSGHFNLVVTGPVFGVKEVPVAAIPSRSSAKADVFFSQLRQELMEREMTR